MPYRVSSAEFARLTSLYRYGVLDTGPDPAIDEAMRVLALRLDVPVARLVLADAQRLWVKSGIGPGDDKVFLRGRGLVDDLVAGGPAFLAAVDPGETAPLLPLNVRSFAGLRLVGTDDEALGVLYVADTQARDLATEAAGPLGAAAVAIQAVFDSGRRARDDEGTGAIKREAFLDQTARLIEVSRIGRQWVSLVTLDLGPFCAALEAKGAGLSSLAMRHMADLGRTQVRRRDSFGRLDANLFAVLLTDTGEAGARILAQRLSRHLERGWTDAGLDTAGLLLGSASMKPTAASDTVTSLLVRAGTTCADPAELGPASRVA